MLLGFSLTESGVYSFMSESIVLDVSGELLPVAVVGKSPAASAVQSHDALAFAVRRLMHASTSTSTLLSAMIHLLDLSNELLFEIFRQVRGP